MNTRLLMVLLALSFTTSVMASEYTHRASLFGGVLHQNDERDWSAGGEYEFRPCQFAGFGVGYERTDTSSSGQGDHFTYGSFFLHPYKGLRLGASLGEASKGDLWNGVDSTFRRYSIGYDFEVFRKVLLTPVWNLNRVNQTDTQTFGLQFSVTL